MSAANRKLAVSVVESVVDTKHVKRQERTWESLIANLAAPQERAAKRELRLLKLVAFGDTAARVRRARGRRASAEQVGRESAHAGRDRG